jgi:hypothetical protein
MAGRREAWGPKPPRPTTAWGDNSIYHEQVNLVVPDVKVYPEPPVPEEAESDEYILKSIDENMQKDKLIGYFKTYYNKLEQLLTEKRQLTSTDDKERAPDIILNIILNEFEKRGVLYKNIEAFHMAVDKFRPNKDAGESYNDRFNALQKSVATLYNNFEAAKNPASKQPEAVDPNPYGGRGSKNSRRGGGAEAPYVKLATSLHMIDAAFASVSPKLHAKLLRDPDYQFLENNLHAATFKNLCVETPDLRQKFFNTVYYKMLDPKEQAMCSASVSSEAVGVMNYYILEEQLGKKYSKAFDKAMMEYNGADSDMTGGFFAVTAAQAASAIGSTASQAAATYAPVIAKSAATAASAIGSTASQVTAAYGPMIAKTAETAAAAVYTKMIIPHIFTFVVIVVLSGFLLKEKFSNWKRNLEFKDLMGATKGGGGNIVTSCIYMQQLTGMTPGKVNVMTDIMKNSKTVMWDCYYAMLKMIRKRKLKTDCENLDAAIKWAKVMPHDYLAKKLTAHRTAVGCQ